MTWLPVYEGFSTYGGMSTKEIEAMAVGLDEMTQAEVAGSSPEFIKYFVERLQEYGVPVVTPPGGLACHVNAREFLSHIPPLQYPAEALNAAMYLVSGARGVERGTMSEDRDRNGKEIYSQDGTCAHSYPATHVYSWTYRVRRRSRSMAASSSKILSRDSDL